MSDCTELAQAASAGVAPALRAVDCMSGEMTASAFGRLFGTGGALLPALTLLLTLYIAFFAISLLTGRSRISISALTPRMITVGLVLTFATSWIAYSQVLWNLAVAAPDWIASVLMGSKGPASLMFADRVDIVFAAIAEASEAARAASAQGGAPAAGASAGMFQPADIMWLGAMLLLLSTVGVLLTARIALAVLMALGPVFVVLALFGGTRGLTAGWLKGVALTAIAPLFVVLGSAITLELLVPVISALSQSAALGEIGGRAALALFLVAAVHSALMALILKVAATITAGWKVFGMGENDARESPATSHLQSQQYVLASHAAAGAHAAAMNSRQREIALAASGAAPQPRGSSQTGPAREIRKINTIASFDSVPASLPPLPAQRARGIGSRLRPRPSQFREMKA
jgi:type IV secretion system protein VirB6